MAKHTDLIGLVITAALAIAGLAIYLDGVARLTGADAIRSLFLP